ncbi:Ribosomal protein S12 methylthiotransferase RimO [Pseudobythopirellula maris]|uniref:Ribosomal protein S12 methylthiotransferase RimO n=1 Tax=Pseudobythopirellula maris TaxID=2527991 RepID=A0A5C5ZQJ6_9BACT|nr:radical SAM protein [Pseudobythopirellula maris]TWT89822.1 Ribosomal protein S12 methylthiotransferase RimO [Pseudobythopirellula maris]
MRVCYFNPPWETDERWGIRAGCRFPNLTRKNSNAYLPFPFLLAYAAAYAEEQGAEVLCIDGIAERASPASVIGRIDRFRPDLVVVETSTTSLGHDLRVLTSLKEKLPECRVAMYGPHVDVRPQDALDCAAVDFVIRGEPERTSVELAKKLAAGESVDTVAGLVLRESAGGEGLAVLGSHRSTDRRALIENLDELPYPHRATLPMDRYNVPGFPAPVMFMYGSRGCPYKCNFCLWPQTMLKGSYRTRSGPEIAAEMDWALKAYPKTKSFFFDDDTFNLGRTRVLEFADEMKRRRLVVPWGMNARADNWDRELMERLIETGLFTLRIGVESGDPEVLRRTQKDINLDQVRETLELSHSLGIKNHVSFVIGMIGETEESVSNTVRYIKTLPVDSVQFSVAIPFPGTSFYDHVEKQGQLMTKDWDKFNGFEDVVVRTETMTSDDLQRAVTRARRQVYFSPTFIRRRLSYVRNLRDLSALTRKAARLLQWQSN